MSDSAVVVGVVRCPLMEVLAPVLQIKGITEVVTEIKAVAVAALALRAQAVVAEQV